MNSTMQAGTSMAHTDFFRPTNTPNPPPPYKESPQTKSTSKKACFYGVFERNVFILYAECLHGVNMSETFSVRIPKELKRKIEQNPDNWSQEVRNFLTERVKQKELLKTLDEIETRAEKRKTKFDSVALIREDRERQD